MKVDFGLKDEDGFEENDGLKEEGSNENESSEMSKSVETEDKGNGANRGIADDEIDVLDPPLVDSPSDDPIEPIANEGVFTDVSIEFLPRVEDPLVSLPRRD